MQGPVVLAVEAGFVAAQDFEVVGFAAERAVSAGGRVLGGKRLVSVGLFLNFEDEAGFFESPDAHLTPAADGQGFDEGDFDRVGGLEECLEGGYLFDEEVGRFTVENDGIAEDFVADGVAGGGGFASFGGGATGFEPVLPTGLDFFGREDAFIHVGFILAGIRGGYWVGFIREGEKRRACKARVPRTRLPPRLPAVTGIFC